ncbi:MAG: hypothetical protein AAF682_30235 [Planctomycetota bacterium]
MADRNAPHNVPSPADQPLKRRELLKRFALLGLLTTGVDKIQARPLPPDDPDDMCGKIINPCGYLDSLPQTAADLDCVETGTDNDCGIEAELFHIHEDSLCSEGGSDADCGGEQPFGGVNQDNDCLPCGSDSDCGLQAPGLPPTVHSDDDGCFTHGD